MQDTQYTAFICGVVALVTIVKLASHLKSGLARYHKQRLIVGVVSSLLAVFLFWLSQDDSHDVLRWKHGASQALFGIALFHLWQVTQHNSYRNNEPSLPTTL